MYGYEMTHTSLSSFSWKVDALKSRSCLGPKTLKRLISKLQFHSLLEYPLRILYPVIWYCFRDRMEFGVTECQSQKLPVEGPHLKNEPEATQLTKSWDWN